MPRRNPSKGALLAGAMEIRSQSDPQLRSSIRNRWRDDVTTPALVGALRAMGRENAPDWENHAATPELKRRLLRDERRRKIEASMYSKGFRFGAVERFEILKRGYTDPQVAELEALIVEYRVRKHFGRETERRRETPADLERLAQTARRFLEAVALARSSSAMGSVLLQSYGESGLKSEIDADAGRAVRAIEHLAKEARQVLSGPKSRSDSAAQALAAAIAGVLIAAGRKPTTSESGELTWLAEWVFTSVKIPSGSHEKLVRFAVKASKALA